MRAGLIRREEIGPRARRDAAVLAYGEAMSTPRRSRPLLVALAPVLAALFTAFWITAEIGRLAAPGAALAFAVLLGPVALAIGLSSARPAVALALVLAVPVLQLVRLPGADSTTWPILEGSLVVAFAVARRAGTRLRWGALLVGLAWSTAVGFSLVFSAGWLSWIGIGETFEHPKLALGWALSLTAVHALLWAVCWTAGTALQFAARTEAASERIESTERELLIAGYELRALKERSEIAQEVHDVLAHSLAVVIALADGSRFLRRSESDTAGSGSTDTSLLRIAETSRSALVDLRGLIEGLTEETDRPQPGLADLPELVRRFEGTGVQVELRESGDPADLAPAQQLAVYRIVQESLTNVLKHGGTGPHASVSLTWDGPGLLLAVASRPGGEAPAAHPARRGFGLAGMEHRARLAGGWLTAGPDPDGSFLVTAFLPTTTAALQRREAHA
ncbi:sensor histidine kinase [Rathayibacter sp. Leaf296]|uniref:sensor histidine kinase n=1 Tax=Rathayibacter sp. Leaf296 TaxID=1736327 RepID=UPI000703A2F7|nr:histidine kinase [Rathayibacter sp. Leaf296]KQQ10094.1 hypothetical protein ASF46_03075 [Rathayibacter sp. Leaf296]